MEAFVLVVLIVLLGLAFDYTNGFHDAANVVATVIATKALRPMVAIALAGVLNVVGATQTSGVAETIATGIVKVSSASSFSIIAAILGAIFWNLLTWYFGMPSSSSYALIGGLIGASWITNGLDSILWNGVIYKVAIPMVASPIIGYVVAFSVMKVLIFLKKRKKFRDADRLFRHLQVGSASIVALAHGLNDAQKSMGIITLGLFATGFLTNQVVPYWVIFACALVIGLGTATGGMKIIRTVGFSITPLKPSQGFAAEASASSVILSASFLGMPISSTHMIVGSVAGAGAAKNGADGISWDVVRKIILAWIITLPGSALSSAFFYKTIDHFISF
ncbi:MAG: inorganic phosphate transporter [Rhabdochlamydiaceae bacterium]|nr:inorganic phosphate transporter [Rhabdochlamydiaceae bacterium]